MNSNRPAKTLRTGDKDEAAELIAADEERTSESGTVSSSLRWRRVNYHSEARGIILVLRMD